MLPCPRRPEQISPWLNLADLMTPTSWAWSLSSLASVVLVLNLASLALKRWMGIRVANIEIDLYPFRCEEMCN